MGGGGGDCKGKIPTIPEKSRFFLELARNLRPDYKVNPKRVGNNCGR